jgi:hypothetical protein
VLGAVIVIAFTGATVAAQLTANVRPGAAPVAAVPPPAAGASAVAPGSVSSTAWYCSAGAPATLILSSDSSSAVRGTVTWVGRAATTAVSVPSYSQAEVGPPAASAGPTAATVFFYGGGVAVSESVHDANGWSVAACASSMSTSWYFPQGSTVAGDTVTLDLYDPSVTPAVVDVDVLTPSGEAEPAEYQGLAVPAGGLVTEHLDAHATNDPLLGVVVEAASGSVVADELDVTTTGGRHGCSEQLGVPAAERVWAFPYTVLPKGGTVSINVLDPGTAASNLVLDATFGSGMAVHPVTVAVKGQSISSIVLGSQPGFGVNTPYSIVVSASSPVVVGRAIYASKTIHPSKRSGIPSAGYTLGVAVGAGRWLVLGVPGVGHPTSFAIEALGRGPVRLTVFRSPGGPAPVPGGRDSATVMSGEEVNVNPQSLSSYSGPLVVVADGPVAVELDAGPSGSPGVVVVPAFVLP